MTPTATRPASRSTRTLARITIVLLFAGLFPAAWAALPAPRGAVVRSAHVKSGAAIPSTRRMIRLTETARALPRAASSPSSSGGPLETWDRLRLHRARRAAAGSASARRSEPGALTRAHRRQHRQSPADAGPDLLRWQRLDRWVGSARSASR